MVSRATEGGVTAEDDCSSFYPLTRLITSVSSARKIMVVRIKHVLGMVSTLYVTFHLIFTTNPHDISTITTR